MKLFRIPIIEKKRIYEKFLKKTSYGFSGFIKWREEAIKILSSPKTTDKKIENFMKDGQKIFGDILLCKCWQKEPFVCHCDYESKLPTRMFSNLSEYIKNFVHSGEYREVPSIILNTTDDMEFVDEYERKLFRFHENFSRFLTIRFPDANYPKEILKTMKMLEKKSDLYKNKRYKEITFQEMSSVSSQEHEIDDSTYRTFFEDISNSSEDENENLKKVSVSLSKLQEPITVRKMNLDSLIPIILTTKMPMQKTSEMCALLLESYCNTLQTHLSLPIPPPFPKFNHSIFYRKADILFAENAQKFRISAEATPFSIMYDGATIKTTLPKEETKFVSRTIYLSCDNKKISYLFHTDFVKGSSSVPATETVFNTMVTNFMKRGGSFENVIYQLTDGENANTGKKLGYWSRIERFTGKGSHRIVCMLHSISSINRNVILFVTGSTTSSSSFENQEMSEIIKKSNKIHQKNIVDFEIIKHTEEKNFEKLNSVELKRLNPVFSQMFLLAEFISTKNSSQYCSEKFLNWKLLDYNQSRWGTLTNIVMRTYVSTLNPSPLLKFLVEFSIKVFVPIWIEVVRKPHLKNFASLTFYFWRLLENFSKNCDLEEIEIYNRGCEENISKNLKLEHKIKKCFIQNSSALLSENFLYCLKLENEQKYSALEPKFMKRDVEKQYSLVDQLKSGKWIVNWEAEKWEDFMVFKEDIYPPPLLELKDLDSSKFLIHNQASERFVNYMK